MKSRIIRLEDEIEIIDYNLYSLGELQEIIDAKYDEIPRDKRSKIYKEYVRVLNTMFDIYNTKVKFKCYNKIKI